MRIIEGLEAVRAEDRGAAVALGNFDGVHRGHQTVIDAARAHAGPEAPLGVVTFEPHPRAFFAPGAPPFRLLTADARAHRLAKLGVERLFVIPFNADLAGLAPADFAGRVLGDGLGVSHVAVGADFRFGKGRAGDAEGLATLGADHGFGVTAVPLLGGEDAFSSTAIRTALAEGRPEEAAHMLGHLHRIDGEVIHGEKRGRELGFPTANMSLDGLHQPKFGVYAVTVDVLDGPSKGRYRGAASIGVRPQFGSYAPNLEVFLFDFSGDLYGAELSVGLVAFLRGEAKFEGVEALVEQMGADCEKAARILEAEGL
ncbi:bifunctional riboflavin kinase/FAD synthetase [Rhodovulum sp. DZ06]|uniref:bifunctional riboflavin kinase/FAD synthetase n=1 Tax=Rhodovulum sp. DZ06 TaxID=3425126 RepID=UPI003D33BAA7